MDADANGTTLCLNCSTALTGPYCPNCGQRHDPKIHTFAHFATEAFENITHADSRLWRTLWILISKPGQLTQEFFDGRRMRYLPPVRFYLVVSLAFFLLAGAISERSDSFVKVDVADKEIPAKGNAARELTGCDGIKYDGPFKVTVMALLPLQCRKILADNGRGLVRAVFANFPRALFVFLPLLAAFMMLLYWRPRRYYVEHLLLLLHNHIFLFIGYGLLLLCELALPASSAVGLIGLIFHIYLAWYFYRGMRVVYGQGRALSLTKYILLATSYMAAAVVTLFLVFAFSAAAL